jgi:hypothetical protein
MRPGLGAGVVDATRCGESADPFQTSLHHPLMPSRPGHEGGERGLAVLPPHMLHTRFFHSRSALLMILGPSHFAQLSQ